MKPGKIVKLTPDQAEELRAKAASGDDKSVKLFLLYAAWRRLAQTKGYSKMAKLRVLSAMAEELKVQCQTTSS